MANNRLHLDGLEALRTALRALPKELRGEASTIVVEAAEGAKRDMRYPRRTGNLADHVTATTTAAGPFGASAIVKNTAPHAVIFENGTEARHTAIGANRGSMPPGHIFVPAVIRRRRQMYQDLGAMLERQGLVVTGV